MKRMTGGQAIVESLLLNGIDTLFGLPGVQLDHLFNALYEKRDSLRVIHSRHEQGCAYMAFGYARSTGRIGAYTVVPGPGFLNSAAALSTAYACNSPVLSIIGQIASKQIGRGFGAQHEITDQLGIFRNLTKSAERIEDAVFTPEVMNNAFKHLLSGRPRPVGVEIAPDILAKVSSVTFHGRTEAPQPIEPDPDKIEQAAKALGAARNPMIIVGTGGFDAATELVEVAEMLQAPVSTSRNAKGTISARHYLSIPESGAYRIWPKVDVVLAIGTRLFEQYMNWGVDKDIKVIHIDIDPAEIERHGQPEIGVIADAKVALKALLCRLGEYNQSRSSRKDEFEELKAEMRQELEKNIAPQMGYLNAIRAELPDDGFIVGESTQLSYATIVAMPFYRPRTFVTPGYQGTLGFGFPTALGVKVANPDKQVISITGDGGFLFGASELATAVQHKIPTVTLLFNDGAYGNVRRAQIKQYGGKVIATDLKNPDFVKLAEAYGAQGLRVNTPKELQLALHKGFNHDGPTIIEIPVTEMPSPWQYIRPPKNRPGGC